jgi:4-amino-4-deoxy-L-arabinose transferase-like glycosyltransferase
MDIDASQYAEISREMVKNADYLHVFDRGIDYLDKPPFLFWMSATSMKIFGFNNFGYKFPSILFALWAIFATWKLARLLYADTTARMAALVFATCQGIMLWTNDVRCDTILTSWVITAIWLIKEWEVTRKLPYLLAGCAAISFGMMTKGPIALMVPLFAFSADWALKRKWRNFVRPQYLLGLLVIAVLLLPMCIGLYQQFDLHPEKIVNGTPHNSGLRFFFWSQSFGRITGENPWKNDVDLAFQLQNMLWSFLPWIVLFLVAMVINTVQLVRQRFRLHPGQEWLTTGGFLLTYLALGSSAYQLPHYIFVGYPLAAIVTARLLHDLIEDKRYARFYKLASGFQATVSFIILLVTLVLIVYVFPAGPVLVALWVVALCAWLFIAFRRSLKGKILWVSAAAIVFANFFLTNQVYYTLLRYQLGSQVGKYMLAHRVPGNDMVYYKVTDPLNAIHFYAREIIPGIDTLQNLAGRHYVLTMPKGLADLQNKGYSFDILMQGTFFKVSELTPGFLNPATRSTTLGHYYFVKLK